MDKGQKILFKRSVRNFWISVIALLVTFVLFLTVLAIALFIKSEAFKHSCEEIQDNNQIFREYIIEQKERSIFRYKENPIPGYSLEEIEKSFNPLINNLKRVEC